MRLMARRGYQRTAAAGSGWRNGFGGSAPGARGADRRGARRYRESLRDRRHLFESYRFLGVARKVVGGGSVGTRAWVVLMMGRDGQDPLFLQAKEAEASVLEPHVGKSEFGATASGWSRPVADAGLERQPSRLAPALGSTTTGSGTFTSSALGREAIGRGRDPAAGRAGDIRAGLRRTLARAHARSGDRIAIGPTSARATRSIRRSPSSRSAMRTRTSLTIAPSDAAKSGDPAETDL